MFTRVLIAFLLATSIGLSAEPESAVPDSLPKSPEAVANLADTIFVIPAGPVAGSFTQQSRITVADTIAGWAKIYVEGWVPVGAVEDRLVPGFVANPASTQAPVQQMTATPVVAPPKQCKATTLKGTQCSRNAKKDSNYCWQHRLR